jgi:hypothetical protein
LVEGVQLPRLAAGDWLLLPGAGVVAAKTLQTARSDSSGAMLVYYGVAHQQQ